jgi:hypothetical protein
VSTALNSGVPLALSGSTEIASEFQNLTRAILHPGGAPQPQEPAKRSRLGLDRIASMW